MGGAHGGPGGGSNLTTCGLQNDVAAPNSPIDMGSSGAGSSEANGGDGGGLLYISAPGASVSLNGTVKMDGVQGLPGGNVGGGGGAGGGFRVQAANIYGSAGATIS